MLSLGTAAAKLVAEGYRDRPTQTGRVIGSALTLAAALALTLGVVFYYAEPAIARLYPDAEFLNRYAGLGTLWLVSSALSTVVTGILYGFQDFTAYAVINCVVGLVTFPITFVLVTKLHLSGAVLASATLAAMQGALMLGRCYRVAASHHLTIVLGWQPSAARQLLDVAMPTFLGELVRNPVPALAVSYLAAQPGGLAQLGLLNAAVRLVSVFNFLPGAAAATLIPILSEERSTRGSDAFPSAILLSIRLFWLALLPITVLYWAGGRAVLALLYGNRFDSAWLILFLLVAQSLVNAVNEPNDRSLIAGGRVWLSTTCNLIYTGLSVVTCLLLIPTMMGVGYALAYLISYGIYVAFQTCCVGRVFEVPLSGLRSLALITVFLALMSLVATMSLRGVGALIAAAILCALAILLEWGLLLTGPERESILKLRFGRKMAGRAPVAANVGIGTRPRV